MFPSPRLPLHLAVRTNAALKWSLGRPTTLASPGRHATLGRRTAGPSSIARGWHMPYSTKPPASTHNSEKKLTPHPERVTATSTTTPLFAPDAPESSDAKVDKKDAQDILHDVKADLNTVKETFSLSSVPRESYILGLAGTLPYLATSLSTVYLAWNIRTQWPTSNALLNSIMVSDDTAHQWLGILEPIQLGYGALIISFLGAIHWGLEYAEKKPSHNRTRFRYAIGVLAPVVAWPTLMMPTQFGLISQFAAFTGMYFVDARATAHGWTPPWYGTYRFVLTFIVGGAIFISLVGRAKVGDERARLSSDRLEETYAYKHNQQHSYAHWAKLEEEERERNRKARQEEEKRRQEEEKKIKEEEEKKSKQEAKSKPKSKPKSKSKSDGDNSGKKLDDEPEKEEPKDDSKDGQDKAESTDSEEEGEQDTDGSDTEGDADNKDTKESKEGKDSKESKKGKDGKDDDKAKNGKDDDKVKEPQDEKKGKSSK